MSDVSNLGRLLWTAVACKGDVAAASARFIASSQSLTSDIGLGPLRIRLTADPDVARRLLITEAEHAHKVAMEHHVLGPVMTDGLILLEGKAWDHRRQAVAAAFASELMPDVLAATRAVLRSRLARWSNLVNISHEARCIVYDVMLRFFAGGQPVGDATGEHTPDAYGRYFATAERALESRIWDPFNLVDRLRRLTGRTSRLGDDAEWRVPLHGRVNRPGACEAANPTGGGAPREVNDALGRLCSRLESKDAVYHELSTEVAAGATSVHHLSWTCQLLASHPEVQARLAAEIDKKLPPPGDGSDADLTELEALPYLSAVVKESLRLYPPAPFLYRRGTDPIPIVVSIWGMHRHPRFWDNADAFVPERWLGVNTDPRAFMPFGLGPRVCIGRRFALIESRAAIADILQRFQLTATGPIPPARLYIMTRPARDVQVRVVPRRH